MTKVTLTENEHRKMQRRLAMLDALEAGGVDNWDGIDFALEDWRKDGEVDDLIDVAIDDLNDILVDADVEQPAGPGAGYSIGLPEADVRKMLAQLMANHYAIMIAKN